MRPVHINDVGKLELIESDPYRTNQEAAVQLYINPAKRWAALETYSPGQAVDFDQWHHRHLTISVKTYGGGPVDGPALVDWLRDDEGQELLSRICDGHSIEWNGNNHVGRLTDDAEDAYNELSMELADADALPEPAGLWDVGDWLDGVGRDAVREEYGITADTTESELYAIAKRIDEEAANENVVLYGTWEYVVQLREKAAEEEEDE